MSRGPDRPEPDPGAPRPDRRQEPCLVVGTQDDRDAGRWLLEGLEQRRLRVLVHPVCRFTIATRAPPSRGSNARSAIRSRTPRWVAPDPPMTIWPPGPSGANRCRSGWSPCSTSRQPRHDRHGRAAGSAACTTARPPGPARASSCRPRLARSAGSRAAAPLGPWPRSRRVPVRGHASGHRPRRRVRRRRACGSSGASGRPWKPLPRSRPPHRSQPSRSPPCEWCDASERPIPPRP